MRLTYAPDVDAMAIWLAPGAQTIGAKEIAPDTYADFDKDAGCWGSRCWTPVCSTIGMNSSNSQGHRKEHNGN